MVVVAGSKLQDPRIQMVLCLENDETSALAALLFNLETMESLTKSGQYVLAMNQLEALYKIRKEAFGY